MHPVLFHIGRLLIPAYGAVTALGVLLSLVLAQYTARVAQVDPVKVWNLCILSLCAALAAARLLLVAVNWGVLRTHPAWLLGLAMVHHPLLAATGAVAGAGCAAWYARFCKLPFAATADALAAPLALGLAFEQVGALLAGAGFGTLSSSGLPWAVTYTHPLAALWSGAPLGVPLHPVQAYTALSFLLIAVALFLWLPHERQRGEVTGLWLMSSGAAIYLTELWRDPEGRGIFFHGAIDSPEIAAVAMVLAGGFVLRERKIAAQESAPLAGDSTPRSTA